MKRTDFVLAVLSTSNGTAWTPVQVQKIFFLLDEKISDKIGRKQWNFTVQDYGPYDNEVYREIENLKAIGQAIIIKESMSTFLLTVSGQRAGIIALNELGTIATYIKELSVWIRSLSFQQLVLAIYRDFPEFKPC